ETVADQALLKVPELITSAPAGALAFVRAAVELNDGWRARSALVDPLLEVSLERRYALPAKRPRALVREPGGTFLVGGSGPYLARFDPCAGADAPPVAEADVAGDVRSAARAGRLVVVGTAAGEVCVLDAATLAELRRVFVGDGGVLGVDVEGTVAVAATADAVVAFDAETGAVLGRFERKGAAFAEVALVGAPAVRVVASPRGFLGARGGQGTRAWVLDLPALTSPVAFEHGARVRALGVAEDVPLAATVDADGRLRLIDVERAALVPIGGAESVAVDGTTPGMAVALDAGGTRVAVGLDRVAELRARSGSGAAHAGRWEAEPTRAAPSLVVFALARDGADGGLSVVDAPLRLDAGTRVSAVAFDPSGARVAAGGWSTTLGVWDARTGEQRAAHRDWNRPDTFHWAEDGSRIVSVGIAESVEVWRERPLAGALRFDPIIDSGPEEPAPLVYGAFVPGTRGRRVVLCDAFGRAALFASPPVPGGGPSAESDERRRFGARIQRLDVAPVGRAPDAARVHVAAAAARVAWLGATGELRVWDVTLGAPALLLDGTVEGFSGGPHFVALDPAGGRVAAVDRSGAVFEGPVDGALRRLRAEPAELVLYAPDGASLFAVARDGALARVATVPDGPSVEYETHGSGRPDRAFDLALSEDGAEVVVAFGRNELVGWDTGTGEVVRSGGRPSPRRFLRYGAQRTLVSAGRGPGTLQVLRDVELPGPKEVPGADVRSLDLSDDGSTAAVATSDGWVIVWDVATGRPLLAPQVHPGGGRAVDLDGVGDGARILSVGADGAALWPLDVLGLATEVAPRGPNRYERGLLENAEEFLR
ncbi:MAG: WD40 repeat domain-containing protein, partial [Planctomycetota bacterium]